MKRRALAAILVLLGVSAFAQQHKISVQKFEPLKYRPVARAANVQGTVSLTLEISGDGEIKKVDARGGHSMLQDAAIENVKKWRFHCDDCKYDETFNHKMIYQFKLEDEGSDGVTYQFPNTVTVAAETFRINDPAPDLRKHSPLRHLFHRRKRSQSVY